LGGQNLNLIFVGGGLIQPFADGIGKLDKLGCRIYLMFLLKRIDKVQPAVDLFQTVGVIADFLIRVMY
jgi:hypothetical protein